MEPAILQPATGRVNKWNARSSSREAAE